MGFAEDREPAHPRRLGASHSADAESRRINTTSRVSKIFFLGRRQGPFYPHDYKQEK
jgi:hypothetical protein